MQLFDRVPIVYRNINTYQMERVHSGLLEKLLEFREKNLGIDLIHAGRTRREAKKLRRKGRREK
jgi:hypothetical protein